MEIIQRNVEAREVSEDIRCNISPFGRLVDLRDTALHNNREFRLTGNNVFENISDIARLPSVYSTKTPRFVQTVNYVPMSLRHDVKHENSFRFADEKK